MEKLFDFIQQDVTNGLIILFACGVFIVIASLMDTWTALEAVKAAKKKPESRPLMKTGIKIMEYLRLIFFVCMIDVLGLLCFSFYTIPYCSVIMTLGIIFREGLSMRENLQLKKSNAIQAIDFAAKIVECLTKEDADKLLGMIQDNFEITKLHNIKDK